MEFKDPFDTPERDGETSRSDWYYIADSVKIRKWFAEFGHEDAFFEKLADVLPPNEWNNSENEKIAWSAVVSLRSPMLVAKAIERGFSPPSLDPDFDWFSKSYFRSQTMRSWLIPPSPPESVRSLLITEEGKIKLNSSVSDIAFDRWQSEVKSFNYSSKVITQHWPSVSDVFLYDLKKNAKADDNAYSNPLLFLIRADENSQNALFGLWGDKNVGDLYSEHLNLSTHAVLEMGLSRRSQLVVDKLFTNGLDLSERFVGLNSFGVEQTLLHSAVRRNDTWLVDWLLENGANADAQNNMGQTPLFVAATLGNLGLMEKLKEAGADVKTVDRYGQNLAHACCASTKLVKHIQNDYGPGSYIAPFPDELAFSVMTRTAKILEWVIESGVNLEDPAVPFKRTAKNKDVVDPFEHLGPAPRRKPIFASPKQSAIEHLEKVLKPFLGVASGDVQRYAEKFPIEQKVMLSLKKSMAQPEVELSQGESVINTPVVYKRERF